MMLRLVGWLFSGALLASACTAPFAISPSSITKPSPPANTPTEFSPAASPASQTQTPIPTVTGPPLPTLSPEERENLLAELLQNNGNCSKPCFWGITPNMSNFDDAVAFLKSLGRRGLEGTKGSDRYYNVIYDYMDKITIGVALLEKNGTVGQISAGLDGLQSENTSALEWSAFRPDTIVQNYGVPSSIKIGLGEGPDGRVIYQLLFIYDTPKLSILYEPVDVAALPTPVLHTCPVAEHGISRIDFWLGRDPEEIMVGMKDIEEVSSLTVEDFSKLLLEKGESACFDINLKGMGNQ